MHLAFDIFQGIGIAAAVGIRPFLPALAVGALAAGKVEIHFDHTDFSFLQSAPFLLAMALGAIALAMLERRVRSTGAERPGPRRGWGSGPLELTLGALALALGALLFGGSLCRGHYAIWPGAIGGVICAGLAVVATRPLLERVRSRLTGGAEATLPLYAETAALLTAVLSVLAPPLGLVALALLIWLLISGRRRGEQKYAGLRILR